MQRSFLPGSKWLYFKIYCGPKTSDEILINHIQPITESLIEDGSIEKWFFIRYVDPDYHLRIRLESTKNQHWGKVLKLLHDHIKPFVDNNLVWKLQIDTYEREVERYGSKNIELVEDIFSIDSSTIVGILDDIKLIDENWVYSLKLIDNLLSHFDLSISEKLAIANQTKSNFAREFNISDITKRQIDMKYRKERTRLTSVLGNSSLTEPHNKIVKKIELRNIDLKDPIQKLLKITKNDKHPYDIIPSLMHMSCNRFFRTNQRFKELIIYHFLYKYYDSLNAKR